MELASVVRSNIDEASVININGASVVRSNIDEASVININGAS